MRYTPLGLSQSAITPSCFISDFWMSIASRANLRASCRTLTGSREVWDFWACQHFLRPKGTYSESCQSLMLDRQAMAVPAGNIAERLDKFGTDTHWTLRPRITL